MSATTEKKISPHTSLPRIGVASGSVGSLEGGGFLRGAFAIRAARVKKESLSEKKPFASKILVQGIEKRCSRGNPTPHMTRLETNLSMRRVNLALAEHRIARRRA